MGLDSPQRVATTRDIVITHLEGLRELLEACKSDERVRVFRENLELLIEGHEGPLYILLYMCGYA